MGDHRNDSADSRYHVSDAHHGTVPVSKVVGRAFVVVYPFGHFGLLHSPKTFDSVLGPPALGVLGALPIVALRRRLHRRA
jgi:signal peptidase I